MEDQTPYTPDPAQLERAFGYKKKVNKNANANTLTKAIMQFARLQGAFGMRINTQGTYDPKEGKFRTSNATKGVSDVIICKQGRMICCEVKFGKDRQSEVQKAFQDRIEQAGGVYLIVRRIEDLVERWGQL